MKFKWIWLTLCVWIWVAGVVVSYATSPPGDINRFVDGAIVFFGYAMAIGLAPAAWYFALARLTEIGDALRGKK